MLPRAPRGLTWAALALVVIGLAVSIYLAYEHGSGSNSLSCPNTGKIDCTKVTTSTYSTFAGVPVAYLGVGWFVVMVAANLPPAWRSGAPWVRWGRLAASLLGVGFAVYLVWAELYRLDAVCLWCTSVHVITLLVFLVILFAEAWRGSGSLNST